MPAKWKCINNEAHIFERATNDFLCTYCKQLGELSMIIAIEPVVPVHKPSSEHPESGHPGLNQNRSEHPGSEGFVSGRPASCESNAINGETSSPKSTPYNYDSGTPEFDTYDQKSGIDESAPYNYKPDMPESIRIGHEYTMGRVSRKEVGLSVLVMDASSSMLEPAFAGSPLSRLSLVAKTAAYGVFDLQHMQNNPNAFVTIIVFDDRVRHVFPDGPISIASLIKRFDADVHKFALFLEEELGSMKQGTDINAALNEAYWVVSNFMENKFRSIYDGQYSPVQQTILKFGTIDSVSIPNVRVLIYTDGMQYDARENRTLLPNPFNAHPILGLNHDVLIGAYFGQGNEDGAAQLSSVVSKCPVHDVRQFFLIDSPTRINSLQSLFRMASGASGFCPKCLESSN